MTLKQKIIEAIKKDGPIGIADYMGMCTRAYYQQPAKIGRGGDFVTAPELTNIYGDILGLWFMVQFQKLSSPQPITFVELGPGRGSMLQDMFNVFLRYPEWSNNIEIHILENSQTLKKDQKGTLDAVGAQYHHHASWKNLFSTLPKYPTFFVSNEFFDSLPIHQYDYDGSNAYLRQVDVSQNKSSLIFVKGPAVRTAGIHYNGTGIYETNKSAANIMHDICQCVHNQKGAFLMIDYGYTEGHGDTLQALYNGTSEHPLKNPGLADITAHVDFNSLKKSITPHDIDTFLTTQGDFLKSLGIYTYLAKAWQYLEAGGKRNLEKVVGRLITQKTAQDMGTLFKVLGGTCFEK